MANYLDDSSLDPVVGDPDDPRTVHGPDGMLMGSDELCWVSHPAPAICTRLKGHAGVHAFGNGLVITEVWS